MSAPDTFKLTGFSMPHRDRATIESWITEFLQHREIEALDITVLDRNFEAGPDSGLVVVTLRDASTLTYIHPQIRQGVPRWVVTFEPRSEGMDLDAGETEQLGSDITVLSELCAFLQSKTDAALSAR